MPAVTIESAIAQAPRISCEECYDVLDDLSTWLALADDGELLGKAHMAWHAGFSMDTPTACCGTPHASSIDAPEIFAMVANPRCIVCSAVYERLYGRDRPELAWDKFEQNEDVFK
jgi:hypothetical protein